MNKLLALLMCISVACADTGDDDCETDCQETVDGGTRAPREGVLYPERWPDSGVKQQALSVGTMPAHVWTPGFVKIVSGDLKFTRFEGGLNSWVLRRYLNLTNAMYTPMHTVNGVPETFLSRPMPDYNCPAGTYTGGAMYCTSPLGYKVLVSCPYVRINTPTHFDYAYNGALVNPTYGFSPRYAANQQNFGAVRMVPEWYHPDNSTTLKRMVTCYYRMPELQVIKLY